MPNIQITEDQKSKLLEITRTAPELFTRRAKLILGYADGLPTMAAAQQAGISRGRARYWKRQFLAKGMEIFNLSELAIEPTGINADNTVMPDAQLIEVIDAVRDANEDIETKDVPFPTVKKNVGITVDDTLAKAGKKVWLYHFAIMLSHEAGTLLGEDEEELHDMRVATRRMRTAFDIFGEAFEPNPYKKRTDNPMIKFEKGLRAVGRALGSVRDMDVILANGIKYQQKIGEKYRLGLEPLFDAWRDEIASKRIKLTRHLESDGYQRFKYEFNRFLQAPESEAKDVSSDLDKNARIRDIVPVLIYNRYASVRAYDRIIPSASITQLHELRIEFKKFRYTLEYFKEILGESAGDLVNEIKQYQDHLGELHDADVACLLVRSYLKEWEKDQAEIPIIERKNPEAIVTYLASLHDDRFHLMASFPEFWKKFNRPEIRQNMAQAITLL